MDPQEHTVDFDEVSGQSYPVETSEHEATHTQQKEKEQTERDFINGYKHGLKPLNHDVIDNYYNETYGK